MEEKKKNLINITLQIKEVTKLIEEKKENKIILNSYELSAMMDLYLALKLYIVSEPMAL